MDIKAGKFYKNKTWAYLLPCLKGHGESLRAKLSSVFKFAVGIHDEFVESSTITEGRNLYILTDKNHRPAIWNKFLEWVRYQTYYVTDYPYGGEVDGRKHMIVLTVPEQYEDAYDKFLEGRYSEMYTEEQQEILYKHNRDNNMSFKVLSKNSEAKKHLQKQIRLHYNTDTLPEDSAIAEYDLPLIRHEEVFRSGDSDKVRGFFITSKNNLV